MRQGRAHARENGVFWYLKQKQYLCKNFRANLSN